MIFKEGDIVRLKACDYLMTVIEASDVLIDCAGSGYQRVTAEWSTDGEGNRREFRSSQLVLVEKA